MRTKTIKIYDSLGPKDDAVVGDLAVLFTGGVYIWYNGIWNVLHIRGDERAQLVKESGYTPKPSPIQDYDRAMGIVS